jgi:site-specific recombinase XerD
MDIHKWDKKYHAAIRSVKKAAIAQKNKDMILTFANELMLENTSKPRIIKYLCTLKIIAENLGKNFDNVTIEDLKQFVGRLQEKTGLSPWTRHSYKIVLKRFYKWVEGTAEYPEKVAWIKSRISRAEQKLPAEGDLLTEGEVLQVLSVAEHPRDKAFLSVLWESGTRISELGNLKMKNVAFDHHGTLITVQGKTGSRKIRIIASTPYIANWLNMHPMRQDPEAPLWINIGTTNHNQPMEYNGIRTLIQRSFEKAGIVKRVHPHLFRHSRATFMARHLTEFQMNQYFGWVQGSGMPATYVHMSGRDVDNAILTMNGIALDEKKEVKINIQKCPRCELINSVDSKHCSRCGGVLDLKYAMEIEEQQRQTFEIRQKADNLMSRLMKDPDVQKVIIEKLKGMV